ncbi:MAG: YopX family protein [Candidatus Omnitrophica bacterium]|nr:YopX family protein [Candidatus Omnitrophota bacterium]
MRCYGCGVLTRIVVYEKGQYILDSPEKKISFADAISLRMLKVIGNIHENPELLED